MIERQVSFLLGPVTKFIGKEVSLLLVPDTSFIGKVNVLAIRAGHFIIWYESVLAREYLPLGPLAKASGRFSEAHPRSADRSSLSGGSPLMNIWSNTTST